MLGLAGELSKPATEAFRLWLWVGLVSSRLGPSPLPGVDSEASLNNHTRGHDLEALF
jgi:hypothetical protein